jgi:hypothetical protein
MSLLVLAAGLPRIAVGPGRTTRSRSIAGSFAPRRQLVGQTVSTACDREGQDAGFDPMSAQRDQIRFQMEEARREFDAGRERSEELARQEQRRFWIQMVVTSIAGVTAAVTLVLHLLEKP